MNIDQRIYGYIAREETFPDKTVIIEEGSLGRWVFIILEGQVKVNKRTPKGLVTIDILKQGATFGESEFFEKGNEVRTISVIADGSVRLGLLDSDQLVKDYESISPQIKGLVRALIRELRHTTDNVVAMAVHSRANRQ
ncbi:MAG: cyclic nucleotide-binding domain-containing protein [Deltaproteobacteria bacterium]|nr:cyclic nucleotide-binding domain-containing protein [Deltaproteobacteria bacterium]